MQQKVDASRNCMASSLHGYRTILLHFEETALNIPQYGFIAATGKLYSAVACKTYGEMISKKII